MCPHILPHLLDMCRQVKQHLEAGLGGDAPAAMRVPLSLGPPRFDTDHRGAVCLGGLRWAALR